MSSRRVVITGASRGIGAAIATELDARGHSVFGLSRRGETAAGEGLACDVTDEMAVRDALARIAAGGLIDVLINNAGLHRVRAIAKMETTLYRQVMDINATAVFTMSREAYPHLARPGGKVINMGSFFDKLGVPDNLAYCASKAAVAAMTRCMAVEWAKEGITAINIAPGYVLTDLNRDFLMRDSVQAWIRRRVPVGRPGDAAEVARFIALLVGDDLPYLTGETIYMDGGHGMNHG